MATEERAAEKAEELEAEAGAEVVYRTKVVQFLGRSTPIILQNDNGPCPLLAISNVLLLRNNLDLSLDVSEITQGKLLSLVAARLLDSNINVQGRDDGYVSNQEQNISDAMDLLPRLATGIDVNVLFRKINDFEFTPECAIFDLLDIGLYHGWIVDPQDTETAQVIGSKSYNTLVAELVAFETRKSEEANKRIPEEDCIDFAAATAAALGVPSPNLLRLRSFDDPPMSVPVDQGERRGDREEAEELIRALNLSRTEVSSRVDVSKSHADWTNSSLMSGESTLIISSVSNAHADSVAKGDESAKSNQMDLLVSPDCNPSTDCRQDAVHPEGHLTEKDTTNLGTAGNNGGHSASEGSGVLLTSFDSMKNEGTDTSMQSQTPPVLSTELNRSECYPHKDQAIVSGEGLSEAQTSLGNLTYQVHELTDKLREHDLAAFASPDTPCADFGSSNGTKGLLDVSDEVTSSHAGSEPIYEGEECILDPGLPTFNNQEPVYEGEVVLAEQADKVDEDSASSCSKDEVSKRQWQLIKNFLENNASQLTIYGLFCLQEGLKERELSVFFRNNHFSTMFKFNGELYLLATDQGYINQPDLVWEKLNEVNGDTIFMTGNFKEFKADAQVNDSWNEQNAMTSTAEYLAALESSAPATSTFNSDLQLAIALQQQEFEQQPQRQQQQSSQRTPVNGRSRLVTGPQVSRSSTASQKTDSKTKDKCGIM